MLALMRPGCDYRRSDDILCGITSTSRPLYSSRFDYLAYIQRVFIGMYPVHIKREYRADISIHEIEQVSNEYG